MFCIQDYLPLSYVQVISILFCLLLSNPLYTFLFFFFNLGSSKMFHCLQNSAQLHSFVYNPSIIFPTLVLALQPPFCRLPSQQTLMPSPHRPSSRSEARLSCSHLCRPGESTQSKHMGSRTRPAASEQQPVGRTFPATSFYK